MERKPTAIEIEEQLLALQKKRAELTAPIEDVEKLLRPAREISRLSTDKIDAEIAALMAGKRALQPRGPLSLDGAKFVGEDGGFKALEHPDGSLVQHFVTGLSVKKVPDTVDVWIMPEVLQAHADALDAGASGTLGCISADQIENFVDKQSSDARTVLNLPKALADEYRAIVDADEPAARDQPTSEITDTGDAYTATVDLAADKLGDRVQVKPAGKTADEPATVDPSYAPDAFAYMAGALTDKKNKEVMASGGLWVKKFMKPTDEYAKEMLTTEPTGKMVIDVITPTDRGFGLSSVAFDEITLDEAVPSMIDRHTEGLKKQYGNIIVGELTKEEIEEAVRNGARTIGKVSIRITPEQIEDSAGRQPGSAFREACEAEDAKFGAEYLREVAKEEQRLLMETQPTMPQLGAQVLVRFHELEHYPGQPLVALVVGTNADDGVFIAAIFSFPSGVVFREIKVSDHGQSLGQWSYGNGE